jgi:uncharacterized protein YdhG (YjbR/CyaY superfamily)
MPERAISPNEETGMNPPKRQSPATGEENAGGLSADERAAMKERLQEQKISARASKSDWEKAVLAKIEAMDEPDRSMALRLHHLIQASAPSLTPRLWYGMPAYAREGKVLCFFQGAQKFKTRYATLGFTDAAHLDEGNMWPVAYALKTLTPEEEARPLALIKKAVGAEAPAPESGA